MKPSLRVPATGAMKILLAAACTATLMSQAMAADWGAPPPVAAAIVEAGPELGVARRLDLSIGRSVVIDLPRDAKEVFVANPAVANAVVRSTRKVFLIGVANGATSVFVMDADGRQIAAIEVNVGRDLNVLRQTLRSAMPKARIEVKPAGDSVLLTGTVASAAEAQQAVDIAKAFVGQSSNAPTTGQGSVNISLSGPTTGAVINALTIQGKDQVMLRVTVAEVSRAVLKQLGVDLNGSWSALDFNISSPFPLQKQILSDTLISGTTRGGNALTTATLRAFERAGVSRILAEPTLTAISGETAKFTAGGEIPVPKSQDCTVTAGARLCQIGIDFKPFGVTLTFTPLVLAESRISLRVATEVTELDYENQLRLDANGALNVPAFRVRKSDTTVELPSGAVMMTAGLIQQTSNQVVNGLPGLMNLPILGTLFRSRDYQRRETELMIIVSPFIAKPMEANQVKRPDDGFVDAHDAQTVLLGRLNKLYGVAGAPPPPPGATYKGRFGFITD